MDITNCEKEYANETPESFDMAYDLQTNLIGIN